MQKNGKWESVEGRLRDELRWCTWHTSSEEFDVKAVESIMYLQDKWEPLEEGTVPPVEEAWERFLKVAGRKELLPVGDAEVGRRTVPAGEGSREDMPGNMTGDMAENMLREKAERNESSGAVETGKHGGNKKVRKRVRFASRHKIIAAAVLVLMVLMVGNTIRAVANPGMGFFFWMKRDDSGVKMMTSPKGLDALTNDQISVYYKQEDVPEWAKTWTQIETGFEFETQENYVFQHFEISELDNRQHVDSYYVSENANKEIYVGVWVYWDKISYFREGFLGYDYVQGYEFDHKEMDIYKRTENTGKVYYIVCFYDGNCRYYVRGGDNLDEIKGLIEKYWRCVQNNS